MKLAIYRLIGLLSRMMFPHYGCCGRCGRTWNICEAHMTRTDPAVAMFALCEMCWASLTPKQRAPYYFELFGRWNQGRYDTGVELLGTDVFNAIARAVEDGN